MGVHGRVPPDELPQQVVAVLVPDHHRLQKADAVNLLRDGFAHSVPCPVVWPSDGPWSIAGRRERCSSQHGSSGSVVEVGTRAKSRGGAKSAEGHRYDSVSDGRLLAAALRVQPMIIDCRTVADATVIGAEVCVVGAGPAGMTVAEELAAASVSVLVIERGDSALAAVPPELEFASPHFESPVDALRFQVGGMVPSWSSWLLDGSAGARYLPLEAVDFEERSWVPHSGWPIAYGELSPYFDRARLRCGVPNADSPVRKPPDGGRTPLRTPSARLITRFDQLAAATKFSGDAFRALARSSPALTLLTGAAATAVQPDVAGTGVVTSVRSRLEHGCEVRSRIVVLAAGGIETPRIMLNSTAWHPAGLGNLFDNVGRYFMDHPRIQLGHGELAPRVARTRCLPRTLRNARTR